eukprot:5513254-Pyramimonas_sp.AAC.1
MRRAGGPDVPVQLVVLYHAVQHVHRHQRKERQPGRAAGHPAGLHHRLCVQEHLPRPLPGAQDDLQLPHLRLRQAGQREGHQ